VNDERRHDQTYHILWGQRGEGKKLKEGVAEKEATSYLCNGGHAILILSDHRASA